MSPHTLFRAGDFVLASGEVSDFKIDCDALTKDDWWALAEQLRYRVPPYGRALGVPSGGLTLAWAMGEFVTPDHPDVLVCDDVWTTGRSMRRFACEEWRANLRGKWHGGVVFARSQPPPEVVALFVMTPGRSPI